MANAERNRAGTLLFWLAGIAVLLLIVFAIRSLTREQVAVRVVPVTFQTLSKEAPTNGKVEPVHIYQAHASGPGVIQNILVEVGQRVTPGTLLVKMSDADAIARVDAARTQLDNARLSLEDIARGGSIEERGRFSSDLAASRLEQANASTNLAVARSLQAKGAASAGEVAAAEQRLRAADLASSTALDRSTTRYGANDRAAAQARVTEAQQNLSAAVAALAQVNIRSPIAGTVYSIPFSQYDFVPSGSEDLLDIADLTKLQVRAYFDEPEIGGLAHGQPVKITWDAKPGVVWHGHVDQVPTTVITYQSTRNVGECIITVDDPSGSLLPNTNVTVTVTEMERHNVLSIPREALHTDGSKDFVYTIADHRLTRTPVHVGVVTLTNVEITSGLTDHDHIVAGPAIGGKELAPGMEVKQVE